MFRTTLKNLAARKLRLLTRLYDKRHPIAGKRRPTRHHTMLLQPLVDVRAILLDERDEPAERG